MNWSWSASLLVSTFILLGNSVPSSAREKQPKEVKVIGVATQVQPALISIREKNGTEVTLVTQEDLTGQVTVGSELTAWYVPENGINLLRRLESTHQTTPIQAIRIQSSVSSTSSLGSIKKVILLPNSQVSEADGLFEAITKFLESRFGWYVAPRVLVEEIRSRAGKPASALETIDPETGEFDMEKYLGEQGGLIPKLASETRVDAVLEVDVEQVRAKVHRRLAAWDGVEEPITSKGSRAFARISIVPERGEVAASTVVLKLWDPKGQLLWNNRRGLAALGVMEGKELRYRPLSEYLKDTENVHNWLATTFSSLLRGVAGGKTLGKKAM